MQTESYVASCQGHPHHHRPPWPLPSFCSHPVGDLRVLTSSQDKGQELRRTVQSAAAPMELGLLQNAEEVRAAHGRDRAGWQAELGWASRWLIDSARIQDQFRQRSVFRAGYMPGGRSRGSRSQPQKDVGRNRCPRPHTEAREETSVQEGQAEAARLGSRAQHRLHAGGPALGSQRAASPRLRSCYHCYLVRYP